MLAEVAFVGDEGGVEIFGGGDVGEVFRVLAVDKGEGAAVREDGEVGDGERADVAHVGIEGAGRGVGSEGAGGGDGAVGVEDVTAGADVAVGLIRGGVVGLAVFFGPLGAEFHEGGEARGRMYFALDSTV